VSAVSTIPSGSQISPANERVYHQSLLVGDWKGSFSKTNQPIELKVDNIRGDAAQVEYTHNGHTERGTATVNGATITYGNVTIATRDGKKAGLEFSFGTVKQTAILDKAAAAADQNKLVGNWIGSTATQSIAFQVLSINGRDAQVRYSIGGQSAQAVGDVSKNAVIAGKVTFASEDGLNGKVTFPVGNQIFSLAVKKFTPKTA
jgi:hypothetical protein